MSNILKCKICGGDLDTVSKDIAICQYCGSKQILPKMTSERKANLYDRANHYRSINEFDKAVAVYEQVLAEDDSDAEIYWDLVLCRYGVEYVEDPRTKKRIPTVNRTQFQSIFDDRNYLSAIEHASDEQKEIIKSDAEVIDRIQKGILDISNREKPYDIFICYKETDNNGRRTPDSVIAQDMYNELTKEGYKVFFSRITLEDKLGSAYEPYIFAALNSAKVMIVVGTRPEHFNAVWVKNEWSRYLGLISAGEKKTLIPAYKDMDPYDLPEEFSHLQAQDLGKLGFMQDLIRGISKILPSDTAPFVIDNKADVEPLLKRAGLFLETSEFDRVSEYCEKVLDIDPENATAYFYKLMAGLKISKESYFVDNSIELDNIQDYQMAIRFADDQLKKRLQYYNEVVRWNKSYTNASELLEHNDRNSLENAVAILEKIRDWKDSTTLIENCNFKLKELEANEKKHEEKRQANRVKLKKISVVVAAIVVIALIFVSYIRFVAPKIKAGKQINEADALVQDGKYDEAIAIYSLLETTPELIEKINEASYLKAEKLLSDSKVTEAYELFDSLNGYKDSSSKAKELNIQIFKEKVTDLIENKEYEQALSELNNSNILDADDKRLLVNKISYAYGVDYVAQSDYVNAVECFLACEGYEDSADYLHQYGYDAACTYMKRGDFEQASVLMPYVDDSNNDKSFMEEMCEKYSDVSGIWKCKKDSVRVVKNGDTTLFEFKDTYLDDINIVVQVDVALKKEKMLVYAGYFGHQEVLPEGTIIHFTDSASVSEWDERGYYSGVDLDKQYDFSFNYVNGKLTIIEKGKYSTGKTYDVSITASYSIG